MLGCLSDVSYPRLDDVRSNILQRRSYDMMMMNYFCGMTDQRKTLSLQLGPLSEIPQQAFVGLQDVFETVLENVFSIMISRLQRRLQNEKLL